MTRPSRSVRFEELLAAALSIAVGLSVVGLANLVAAASSEALAFFAWLGTWIPGGTPFQAFVGMEILALAGWLLSWTGLARWVRGREIRGVGPVLLFVAWMAVATLLLWPPTVALLLGLRAA